MENLLEKVMEKALKTGESNACMKRIVAAPTAGSCGVVPAVFLTLEEEKHFSEEKMVEALYVVGRKSAAWIAKQGVSRRGSRRLSGLRSARLRRWRLEVVAYLMGGDAEQISHAAAWH